MNEIEELKKLLSRVMDEDYMDEWIRTPNPGFQGMTPLKVVEIGRMDVIEKMVEEADEPTYL